MEEGICHYLKHFLLIFQNPVAHVAERTLIKRKFCNVCRKRMEDITGYCCEGKITHIEIDNKLNHDYKVINYS